MQRCHCDVMHVSELLDGCVVVDRHLLHLTHTHTHKCTPIFSITQTQHFLSPVWRPMVAVHWVSCPGTFTFIARRYEETEFINHTRYSSSRGSFNCQLSHKQSRVFVKCSRLMCFLKQSKCVSPLLHCIITTTSP